MNKQSISYILTLILLCPLLAFSVTINVPADQPTIQAGINAAVNGDSILVSPGIYLENINFQGKQIVICASGSPISTTIMATDTSQAVVYIGNGEPKGTEISGFSITGGGHSGILCIGSSPSIKNNIIYDNKSGTENDGGGICSKSTSNSLISGNIIYNNTASPYGAGIHIGNDNAACVNDTICHNLIYDNTGIGGVRVLNSSAIIFDNTISHLDYDCIIKQGPGTIDIRNNILINSNRYGIYLSGGAGLAEYNCVWNCAVGAFSPYVNIGTGNIYV